MNKDINYDDINIEEYEKITISLDDIKKKKMKKKLVGIIKRRNSKKVLIAAIAMILIISTINITSMPTIAKSIPMLDKIYKELGFHEKYLPKSKFIGQSIEENGVRVTIDNIIGTKRIIMLSIKVEKIDGTLLSDDERLLLLDAKFGERKDIGSGGGSKRIDDKTEMMVLSLSSMEELPGKGELKLNINRLNGSKFNEGFNLNVDFAESYDEVLEKNFSVNKDIGGINIKKIEATTIGAILEVENYDFLGSKDLILKIDDKIFINSGIDCGDKEKSYLNYLDVSYEDIENAKTISVIENNVSPPVSSKEYDSLSEEELEKQNREYQIKENILKEKMNSFPKAEKENVQYIKEMTFNNGNKAEIYNIERVNNILRVYIKGQDKKQVLALATSILSCDLNESNYEMPNRIIENSEGYVVELNDRNNEGIKIKFGTKAMEYDGNKIGEEVILDLY